MPGQNLIAFSLIVLAKRTPADVFRADVRSQQKIPVLKQNHAEFESAIGIDVITHLTLVFWKKMEIQSPLGPPKLELE